MDKNLVTGTLEMLILDVLSGGESYGYAIAQAVLSGTGGEIELKEGSLYPALHRMERQGLLEAKWGESEEGRRRKYYRITAHGVKALEAKRAEWGRFEAAVNHLLGGPAHGMA